MSEPEFKAGDLIYCPIYTTKISKLKDSGCNVYPFEFYYLDEKGCERFGGCTADGKLGVGASVPAICHATEENHAKLESLFGVKFEKPKPKTTPREVIKYLLTKQKYVLCQVSDYSEDDARKCKLLEVIVSQKEGGKVSYDDINNLMWYYAIPIDLQGNEITEID